MFAKYFEIYPSHVAPFMHLQRQEWHAERPLAGLTVLHHVPVVPNTLLKIACLIEAGAIVTVTNPSFMTAHPEAVASLLEAGVRYIENLSDLVGESFDIYFDCGAELFQVLGAPRIGAVELTGSGDQFYRKQLLNFPVVSIDPTLTKQLETVFGCAESSQLAIANLTGINPADKSWIIFGFGKIGRGLAYYCVQHGAPVVVVDTSENQRQAAALLGIKTIDPRDKEALQIALDRADIVLTATGGKAILNDYPRAWFSGKILANMGVYDEYGPQFQADEVLYHKQPVNFALQDPTPMKYIDPEFYIHNIAGLVFTKKVLSHGVHDLAEALDLHIIQKWCDYHAYPLEIIQKWFVNTQLYPNPDELINFRIDENGCLTERGFESVNMGL